MGLQNSTGASSVRFNTPEDWPEWSNAIKTMATAASIWEYIDPEGITPMPKMPERPKLSSGLFPKRLISQGPHASQENRVLRSAASSITASATTSAGASTSNTASDDLDLELVEHTNEAGTRGIPADPSELTKIGKIKWDYAQQEYKNDRDEVRPKHAAATQLAAWIQNTISTDYRRSIKEKTDLRDMYTTLREHYTPFETMIFRKVRTAYKDHIQQAKKYENKMGEWVTQWKSLMDEAIRQDIPDAKDPKSWFTDLTEAMIRSVTGRGIADGYLLSVQADVYAGLIGYKTLGVTLAQRFATTKSAARPPKAAFPAFQGESGNDENDQTDRGSRRGGRETRRGRGRGNNAAAAPGDGISRGARGARSGRASGQAREARRSREASDEPDRKKARFNSPGRGNERCEACQSSYHGLPDCWYVNPEDAADRWTPNSQITSLVQMRIKSHPDLAARVEAVQLERRQRQG